MGNTEEAFRFYKSVFQTEFVGQTMPIVGGHVLMGTDALESMGHTLTFGNNFSINLEPDERAETERLFKALSEGGKVSMPLQDMFWGAYFGSLTDKFGVQWMFNCAEAKSS